MNCDQCTERFGDAVDGTLSPGESAQIDAHCRTCQACGDLLSDLMKIRAAAAALDRLTPSPAVWTAIASSVRPRSASARIWLPAAAALVIMVGAATWFDLSPSWRSRSGDAADVARTAVTELQLAERHYENAIRSLEQLTINKDTTLDAAVVAEIAQSLQSIDRAITDSRAALRSEPESFVAQTSLLEALRMKVALLQETVTLMNARS